MKTPGTSSTTEGTLGGGNTEDNAKEVQLKGRDLRIPSPAYLQRLLAINLDFSQLKAKLENDFPGYTLPCEEDIKTLKLREEHENLRKLTEGLSFPGNHFNVCFYEEDGGINRSGWSVSGNSLNERYLSQNDQQWPHPKGDDFIFLVKKEVH